MDDKKAKQTAGALDVRNIIGTLMVVYGVILLAMDLFSDTAGPTTGDIHANLYASIGLLAVGAVFLAWAKLRPIVVPQDVDRGGTDEEATTPPTTERG